MFEKVPECVNELSLIKTPPCVTDVGLLIDFLQTPGSESLGSLHKQFSYTTGIILEDICSAY